MNKAIEMILGAGALLLAGCAKETPEDVGSGVEIVAQAELPASVSVSGASTRAVVDPSQEMTLWFARSDADTPTTYGPWQTPALKAVRAGGADAQQLTFDPAQYYLTNGMWSRMVGWYPGGGVLPGGPDGYYDGTAVSWTIDGRQDILLSRIVTGVKTRPIMDHFTFAHALAQVRFYFYAENEQAAAAWGPVEGVTVLGQRSVASFIPGNTSLDFSGEADGVFSAANFSELTVPAGTASDAVPGGDPVMIEPQNEPVGLTLAVRFSEGGQELVTVAARSYPAGECVKITVFLREEKTSLVANCEIVPWESPEEVEVGGGGYFIDYPYVLDGTTFVFKDFFGRTEVYPLHGIWTETPAHEENNDSSLPSNLSGCNTCGTCFEVASADAGNMPWADAQTACASYRQSLNDGGWRLPTALELRLIYRYRDRLTGISLADDGYWSATAYSYSQGWLAVGNNDYFCSLARKLDEHAVRCVRDAESAVAPGGYPYITDGNIVVFEDYFGSADPATYPTHDEPWTETPESWEKDVWSNANGVNTFGKRFMVYRVGPGNFERLKQMCAALGNGGWRLPTGRELDHIFNNRALLDADKVGEFVEQAGRYYPGTTRADEAGTRHYARGYNGTKWTWYTCTATSGYQYALCVKDIY